MNNDLISREALKKALEEDMKYGGVKTDEFDKGYDLGVKTAIEMLDKAPTADRPHGKWIEQTEYNGDTYYDCSICGNSWCMIDGTPWNNGMNYCPNCGAKMDGGEQ